MDLYSYTTTNVSASSSSSPSFSNLSNSSAHQHQEKTGKPPPPYRSALHSVRKLPFKNVILKKPIAPMPPTPPKIYKVDPADFRDVVQKLTGAPEFHPTRLQEVTPPPNRTPLVHPTIKMPLTSSPGFAAEAPEEKHWKSFDGSLGTASPLGFSLSPSSLAWFSSVLLSP
ncbi:uncharacterized protein LOC105177839 [Sesamum indicum]|uniref:Uncharacterized protein LOC105177839 n=1 Tax=Sesamum indicum TaxID=4182 RepID=A0A6I9UWA4_SESIN|nr:uncharacterized protein LOC105177839 [Sesamum indicum]